MAQRATYRAALMGEPAQPSPRLETPWQPAPILALPTPALANDDPFECAFLDAAALDDYLAHAVADQFDPRYAVFAKIPDWPAGRVRAPLELCEFLAYKSVLAYHDNADIETHFKACNWRGVDQDSYKFFDANPDGDAQGFGFVSGDTAYIVMRGSTSFADWRANLDPTMSTSDSIDAAMREKIGGAEPERHFGFARAWAHVAPKVEEWAKTRGAHVKHLCFTGHSQGGALAILGAHDFARRGVAPVGAVVTFASPKVGSPDFIADYERLGLASRTLRCESPEDAVTLLARQGGLQAPGRSCLVDKRPMIAGMEKFWAALLFIAGWRDVKNDAGKAAEAASDDGAKPSDGADKSETKPGSGSSSTNTDKPKQPATEVDPRTALAYIALIVGAIVVFIVARRVIIRYRAHGAGKRYALFFTTLAYQRIRAARIADPKNVTDAELKRASDDLDAHLRYIRGADASIDAYAKLAKRPIRALDKATFLKLSNDIRAVDDDSGPSGHYAGYIW